MNKKVAALITAAAVVASAFTLAGCNGENVTEWSRFSNETLISGEVRVSAANSGALIRWAETDGASAYDLYSSASRFGDYTLIKSDIEDTKYKATDAYAYYKVVPKSSDAVEYEPSSAFSSNTLIVSPSDDMQAVQNYINEKHDALEKGSTGQFSSERVAVMFLPGEYPEIEMKTGYYTSVMGLGGAPTDVTLGSLYVSTNVLGNNNSTCTFWRGVENVTIDSDVQWAVSQATSMRRVQVNGNLALSHPTGWSSGGFLANSKVTGTVNSGTQQQWMSRNDEWKTWARGGSHNLVFSGCEGSTPESSWNESGRYTVERVTERMAEKPFVTYDEEEGYGVFVPEFIENTRGITWKYGHEFEKGKFLSMSEFYVANGNIDDANSLNAALKQGKNLLLTPGHYALDEPLEVNNADTVVLGMGYATLTITDKNKDCAIRVADVDGVRLANFLVDAGSYSKNMIVVGSESSNARHTENPIVMSDMFLRIGGVANVHTETDTAMVINAHDTVGDNFWIWRADHSKGVAWDDVENEDGTITYGNPVKTGLFVGGDDVSCYALMVEHCEEYQTYWQGEGGLTVMYQSETPYRVPTQDVWMSKNGEKRGYASYKVADVVETHRAIGIGVYWVNYSDVVLDSAIEVPEKAGIDMQHLVTCNFTNTYPGSITNVINDYGGAVSQTSFRRLVEKYPL